ncbi:MAG TPA: hypothetical protein VH134_09425 [Candidatus Dormibacteraeota bacterium]|nr:hypothetical protein [Candidatus Dormibacteraeota bacterium]
MTPRAIAARLVPLAALGLAVTGCGNTASDALHDTAGHLASLHSGRLALRVTLGTRDGHQVGFAITGPFSLARSAGLPVADLRYVRVDGTSEREVSHIVSTGGQAYSVASDGARPLPAAAVAELRQPGAGAGLGYLHPDTWLPDPQLSSGPTLAGVRTDRITGRADVVALFDDVLPLLTRGTAGSPLAGSDADLLRRVVSASSVTVDTGHDDRLLRSLDIAADLGRQRAPAGSPVAGLDLVRMRIHVGIDDPDGAISVAPPAGSSVASAARG